MTDKNAGDRILDAANDLFGERGYSATTTRALAERAGVNEVTIFRLFGSKLGVLRALGERFMAVGAAELAQGAPLPEGLTEAVTELALREVRGAERSGAAAMRLAFEANSVPEIAELMGEGPARNQAAVAAFFEEQQRLGRVRADLPGTLMADAFFALTSTYVMSRMLLGSAAAQGLSNEEAVRGLVQVLLNGIETGE